MHLSRLNYLDETINYINVKVWDVSNLIDLNDSNVKITVKESLKLKYKILKDKREYHTKSINHKQYYKKYTPPKSNNDNDSLTNFTILKTPKN